MMKMFLPRVVSDKADDDEWSTGRSDIPHWGVNKVGNSVSTLNYVEAVAAVEQNKSELELDIDDPR